MPTTLNKLKNLTSDYLGIGVLTSATIALVSIAVIGFTIFKLTSLTSTPDNTDTVETTTQPEENAPAEIKGFIWTDTDRNGMQDEGETGLAALPVSLVNIDTASVFATINTDAEGKYTFSGVTPGNYEVQVVIAEELSIATFQNGENKEKDSDMSAVTESAYGLGRVARSLPLGIASGSNNIVDGGLHTFEEISGKVWEDINKNGQLDLEDKNIANIVVSLLDENNNVMDSRLSGEQGDYSFTSMGVGKYSIKFESNNTYTTQDPNQPNVTLEQLVTAPKYSEIIDLQTEQKIKDINTNVYELTPEIKQILESRVAATPVPTATVEVQATTTPAPVVSTSAEPTAIPTTETQPTATPTLSEVPSETPTETTTIGTSDESTGSGSGISSTATPATAGDGSSLVRTGLPIFILGILGGINLIMLKYTNGDKDDTKLRRRKIKRYIPR